MSSYTRRAPGWLSVPEAADYLHTRDERIREAIASGALAAWIPAEKQKGVIVHTDDLDAWVRGTYDPAMCLNAARRVVAKAGAR